MAGVDLLDLQLQFQQREQVVGRAGLVRLLHQRRLDFALLRIGFAIGVQGAGELTEDVAHALRGLLRVGFAPLLRGAGLFAARPDLGVVFGFLGRRRLRLQPMLHAREQVVLRVDALVIAQIKAGHGFGHVLHRAHHLLQLGVEVDLGVPGEQHLEFLVITIIVTVARMQQPACGVAHQLTQCLGISLGHPRGWPSSSSSVNTHCLRAASNSYSSGSTTCTWAWR